MKPKMNKGFEAMLHHPVPPKLKEDAPKDSLKTFKFKICNREISLGFLITKTE